MSHTRAVASAWILFAAVINNAVAADTPTTLDLSGKAVKKLEVSQTQIGYTSTTVFYTLGEQRVIVVLRVENTKNFAVSGKVCQFGKGVTAEGMAKWVNNQHSDGLFPDVPEPETTTKLTAEACKTGEAKSLGKVQGGQGEYEKYTVEFTIEKVKVNDQLQLAEFKEKVSVFVPAK